MNAPPRLLDQLRHQTRVRHYSYRTEQAYVGWVRRFIHFHNKRHPASMGAAEVEAFLSYLASERNVAAATQAQALSAVLFLYKAVLGTELPWLDNIVRATRPRRLPVVLSQAEARAVIGHIDGTQWLIVNLLYGSGLRVLEALRLRIKDIDLQMQQLTVRDGKGGKDRVTMVPTTLIGPLTVHLQRIKEQHEQAVRSRIWRSRAPIRTGAKVSDRSSGLGLAVRVSFAASNRESSGRDAAPPPYAGILSATFGARGGKARWHHEACLSTHLPA